MATIEQKVLAARFLGVEVDAPGEVVRAAYRAAAKTAHPDMAGGSDERFRLLLAAFQAMEEPVDLPPNAGPAALPQTPQRRKQRVAVGDESRHDLLAWLRGHVRLGLLVWWLLVAAVVWLLWHAVPVYRPVGWILAATCVLLGLWRALGRPTGLPRVSIPGKGLRRGRGAVSDDPPTAPIPVITPEMLRGSRHQPMR